MATRKAAGKKSRKRNGPTTKQVDDPIIIKPGNSITMEFDSKFAAVTNPSASRRKRKHGTANALTAVWIYRNGVGTQYALNPGDFLVVCYDKCGHCP